MSVPALYVLTSLALAEGEERQCKLVACVIGYADTSSTRPRVAANTVAMENFISADEGIFRSQRLGFIYLLPKMKTKREQCAAVAASRIFNSFLTSCTMTNVYLYEKQCQGPSSSYVCAY